MKSPQDSKSGFCVLNQLSDIQNSGCLFLNSTWSEGIINNIFYSTQNPLQCSFHTWFVRCVDGNRLGRRAGALQRRLWESPEFQEIQMLHKIHQKVDVWRWCLKRGFYHWLRSRFVRLLSQLCGTGNPGLFQLLSSA